MNLEIIYQDDLLVAIHKPAGMLVHRSEIDRHETIFAQQLLRKQLNNKRVYLLHRLDKPTSGVLLFALNPDIARQLSIAMAEHQFEKTYLAIARGYTEPNGVIDYPLEKLWDKMTDQLAKKNPPPQPAITQYERLGTVDLPFQVAKNPTTRYSLVKLTPLTGRTRQIRRHMKHIFHPIVGDTTHGDGKHNVFFRQQFDCHRLLLHASTLTFIHPVSEEKLTITAPLDETFQRIVTELNFT